MSGSLLCIMGISLFQHIISQQFTESHDVSMQCICWFSYYLPLLHVQVNMVNSCVLGTITCLNSLTHATPDLQHSFQTHMQRALRYCVAGVVNHYYTQVSWRLPLYQLSTHFANNYQKFVMHKVHNDQRTALMIMT